MELPTLINTLEQVSNETSTRLKGLLVTTSNDPVRSFKVRTYVDDMVSDLQELRSKI